MSADWGAAVKANDPQPQRTLRLPDFRNLCILAVFEVCAVNGQSRMGAADARRRPTHHPDSKETLGTCATVVLRLQFLELSGTIDPAFVEALDMCLRSSRVTV